MVTKTEIEFEDAVRAEMARGKSYVRAVRALDAKNPGLRQRLIAEANAARHKKLDAREVEQRQRIFKAEIYGSRNQQRRTTRRVR